jgi:dihydropyrimidine dehydrogenase (NAD+) subunit PreA
MFEGYGVLGRIRRGLLRYMTEHGFSSIDDMRGQSLRHLVAHHDLSREHKMVAWSDPEVCRQCGSCYVACRDAGYQAITWEKQQRPVYLSQRCDGCSLCVHVCPEGAVQMVLAE